MKQYIMAIAAAIVMSTAAQAQEENQGQREGRRFDRTEMIQRRTDEAVKKYQLDANQAKALLELNTKFADQMGPGMGPRGPRRDGGPRGGQGQRPQQGQGQRPQLTDEQRAKMRAEREAAMKEYDAELQKILTADQYKSYKEDMERNRPQGGPRDGRPQEQK